MPHKNDSSDRLTWVLWDILYILLNSLFPWIFNPIFDKVRPHFGQRFCIISKFLFYLFLYLLNEPKIDYDNIEIGRKIFDIKLKCQRLASVIIIGQNLERDFCDYLNWTKSRYTFDLWINGAITHLHTSLVNSQRTLLIWN